MKPIYIEKFIKDPKEVHIVGENISKKSPIFEHLLSLDWLEVVDARKEYFMSETESPIKYDYGKDPHIRSYYSKPFTKPIKDILDKLNQQFEAKYNVCFLNRYDTQKNQLGWHSDSSLTMDSDHAIGVISFGAEREIWWRKIGDTGVVPQENRQLLQNGSLWVMPERFQDSYQHRIPKCDRECGIRISLTFRRYV